MRGQLPFSFCMGLGLAGAVANRMFREGHKLAEFRHLPIILVAAVLLICVAPYFVLASTLMRVRRRGMLRYGAFARAVGEPFEEKWLDRAESLNEKVLTVRIFLPLLTCTVWSATSTTFAWYRGARWTSML